MPSTLSTSRDQAESDEQPDGAAGGRDDDRLDEELR